jgi:hypothetical protein
VTYSPHVQNTFKDFLHNQLLEKLHIRIGPRKIDLDLFKDYCLVFCSASILINGALVHRKREKKENRNIVKKRRLGRAKDLHIL